MAMTEDQLPERLKDPMITLWRGRKLLKYDFNQLTLFEEPDPNTTYPDEDVEFYGGDIPPWEIQ